MIYCDENAELSPVSYFPNRWLSTIIMQWIRRIFLITTLGFGLGQLALAQDYKGKRVFILHSYDEQYPWTYAIHQIIRSILTGAEITSQVFYLDTKHHASEAEKLHSAQQAKLHIEQFKPDVVITSDDDAVKYVLMPYYKNSKIPFVFCGLNVEPRVYGLPYRNTTGMLEVELLSKTVKNLQDYTKGQRIGTLALDGFSERKRVENYREQLGKEVDRSYFSRSVEEWQEGFLRLQHEVDMVILLNPKGLTGFDMDEAQDFVERNIRVPTGSYVPWMSKMSLLGITLIPEEQGAWAAQAALKILSGQEPDKIPITQSKEGKLFINMRIAEKLGITFKSSLLRVAEIIR